MEHSIQRMKLWKVKTRLAANTCSETLHFFKTHSLCFLQNPSFLIRHLSISSTSTSSFVVSYLVNTCGLSEDKAISASKQLHFETSSRPDSILALLEEKGFTKSHISKLITCCPTLLLANPDKTLKPKLEFFNSIGLSGLDLAKVLSATNSLQLSLENQIIPKFAFLKSIVHTDSNVIASLKRSAWVLQDDFGKRMLPNIEILRDQGVPESNIKAFLITQPRALRISVVRFKEIVDEVNNMGFHPLQYKFISAIHALTAMSKSTWEAKLDVYRRWNWSEDEIQSAFRKQPCCMMASEKKIMAIMDFFVNKMGFSASLMAEHPNLLLFSLEKRIRPRCLVLRVLVSKGLVKKNISIASVLSYGEKSFIEKYVIKYAKEVPGLQKVYQDQLDMLSRTAISSKE